MQSQPISETFGTDYYRHSAIKSLKVTRIYKYFEFCSNRTNSQAVGIFPNPGKEGVYKYKTWLSVPSLCISHQKMPRNAHAGHNFVFLPTIRITLHSHGGSQLVHPVVDSVNTRRNRRMVLSLCPTVSLMDSLNSVPRTTTTTMYSPPPQILSYQVPSLQR